ncbi:class I SAM-dependent methyltransferase [Roseovarius sp. 2305UL8-3]|uniref:class I SAM-dependent methyltransferase n=1 Tax=Roseovarius conchicola TaxID=3121636 RepID=UPI0035275FBD
MNLKDDLTARIVTGGPMTLAEYMGICLMHPEHGYYATRDPLGAAGDFTTAPEISQMFGELLGLSLAQSWLDQGAPSPFALAELGPGRGTLMADMLRATKTVPEFHAAAQVHLVEVSPHLRDVQEATLRGTEVAWHDTVESLPDLPLFLVANEFFDALPIRQVVRDGPKWRERLIGVKDDTLSFGLSGPMPLPILEHRLEDTKDGDVVEFSPVATMVAEALGARIKTHGGAALIVDYGDWRAQGDTFQAVQGHQSTDPLAEPGQADLTAHVDFEALALATPSAYSRLTPQGVFLERLGITARAQALAEHLQGDALDQHIAAHHRLTHPGEMGTLFKVLGLYPEGGHPPPGLEA